MASERLCRGFASAAEAHSASKQKKKRSVVSAQFFRYSKSHAPVGRTLDVTLDMIRRLRVL
jgi:hypothetical protein